MAIKRAATAAAIAAAALVMALAGPVDGVLGQRSSPPGAREGAAVVERADVDCVLREWPDEARLATYLLIRKYGLPQEATPHEVVWYGNGSWKRTIVHGEAVPHLFPMPHSDVVEQVIAYRVPADAVDDLAAFDGSVSVARTAGELSVRGESEAMNFIAVNLAVEILRGDKSVEQARAAFGEALVALLTQPRPPDLAAQLQFAPAAADQARDRGDVTVPGAPRPLDGEEVEPVAGGREPEPAGGDREVVGALVQLNENEVRLGRVGLLGMADTQLETYAQQLERDHGQALERTLALGAELAEPPVRGLAARRLEHGAARDFAVLVSRYGPRFDAEFLDLAIRHHARALRLVDQELLPGVQSEPVRRELARQRELLAIHLEQARALRAARR